MGIIIVAISGGLGNQMFQYAAGRALALRLDVSLKLDLSWFDSIQSCTSREYMLHIFSVAASKANPKEIERIANRKHNFFAKLLRMPKRCNQHYVLEPSFRYWPGFASLSAPTYLDGYWQQEQYFADIADVIRQDFSFPSFDCPDVAKLAAEIASSSNAVCVHIRRGDYVENPVTRQFHGVCSPTYYAKALQMLTTKLGFNLKLFLFTDDPAWVRKNFDTQGHPAIIVDFPGHQDKPWHDMHLMSLGAHHIIANSSFSWWGAWLGVSNGIVCAPRQWFAPAAKMPGNPAPKRWRLL